MSRQPIKFSTLRNQLGLTGRVSFRNIVVASGGTVGGSNGGSNLTLTTTYTQVNNFAPGFPANFTHQLWANSLSSLSHGAAVSNWSNFIQNTTTVRPSFNIDSGNNFKSVRFIGTSSTNRFLNKTATVNVNFATGGGATNVLMIRFTSSFLQFHRVLHFDGNTIVGNARTYEFYLAVGGNNQQTISPKFYYATDQAGTVSGIPLNKWTLIVSRFTNGSPNKHEIFVNNMTTPVLTTNTTNALANSVMTTFNIGASGTPGGNQDIHFHALYPRALSASDMQALYSSFSGNIQL